MIEGRSFFQQEKELEISVHQPADEDSSILMKNLKSTDIIWPSDEKTGMTFIPFKYLNRELFIESINILHK